MADVTPEEVPPPRFRKVFRGLDPIEVEAELARLHALAAEAAAQRDRLAARLAEIGSRDLKGEFAAVAEEVGAVLEAARQAAESLRERASADAARWRAEAIAEAEQVRREARADAEHLRGDAWSTSEELLKQVVREVASRREAADRDAVTILGEAERESHRITSSARREADEVLRTARMEADRMRVEAEASRDEIIESARRAAATAQERTQALEARRRELMDEIEQVKAALAGLESGVDARRESLGLSAEPLVGETHGPSRPSPRAAPVVGVPDDDWAPGETVRVVRRKPAPADKVEDVDELVMKVTMPAVDAGVAGDKGAVAPAGAGAAKPEPEAGDGKAGSTADAGMQPSPAERGSAEDEALTEKPPAEVQRPGGKPSTAKEAPAVKEASVRKETQPGVGDDGVSDLFARLKSGPGQAVQAAPGPAKPVEDGKPDEASIDPPAESPDEPAADFDPDEPFERRERLLLPIMNRALRNLKRQLVEEQNQILEDLRTGDGWSPSVEDVTERVQAELKVLHAESFGAGYAATTEMLGRSGPRPATPQPDVATPFARDLCALLGDVVAEGEREGHGPRQLGSAVSRIFRGWRTDEAERRVRAIAYAAFHEGIRSSATLAGHDAMAWVVAGRGCATCRAAAEDPAPEALPPLHAECGCTIVL